jgi:hypothetical protein
MLYFIIALRCINVTSFAPSKNNVVHCSFIGHYFNTCFSLTGHLQVHMCWGGQGYGCCNKGKANRITISISNVVHDLKMQPGLHLSAPTEAVPLTHNIMFHKN